MGSECNEQRSCTSCLWAFEVCPLSDGESVLDVGCGGGGNLVRILERFPQSRADGIDYSEESVACSRKVTRKFADRCSILYGDAMHVPYRDDTFDRAVSFEPYISGRIRYAD